MLLKTKKTKQWENKELIWSLQNVNLFLLSKGMETSLSLGHCKKPKSFSLSHFIFAKAQTPHAENVNWLL